MTSRSGSHLLVVTKLREAPEPVKVVTATVVDVTGAAVLLTTVVPAAGDVAGDAVLLTTVVLAAGATVEVGVTECRLMAGVVTGPYAVAQYWE